MISAIEAAHTMTLFVVSVLFCLFAMLACESSAARWKLLYQLMVVAAGFYIAWQVCIFTLEQPGTMAGVQSAVGYSAYFGLYKNLEIRAYWLMLAVVSSIAVCGEIVWQRLNRRPVPVEYEFAGVDPPYSRRFLAAFMFVLMLLLFPSVGHLLADARNITHSLDYDAQNITTWHYFRYTGLTPLRDFWYPYGAFLYLNELLFPDMLFLWLHKLLVIGVCFVSVYRLSGYSSLRTLSVFAFLAWMFHVGLIEAYERYFISAAIVLMLACCILEKKKILFFSWGLMLAYGWIIEPSQLVYSAPGALLLSIAGLFAAKNKESRICLLRSVALGAGIAFVCGLVYLACLYGTGALPEYLLFLRTMGDVALYAMLPVNFGKWYYHPMSFEGILFYLVVATFVLSLWHAFSRFRAGGVIFDAIPLAISLIAVMLFQKQLIRPVPTNIIGIPAFAFGLLAIKSFSGCDAGRVMSKIRLIMITVIAIVVFAIPQAGHEAPYKRVAAKLAEFPMNLRLVLLDRTAVLAAERAYFAPDRFIIDGMKGSEFQRQLLSKIQLLRHDELFVLGDDSYLYILLNQLAPFYVSIFNQSIIHSQQKNIAWLEEHKPSYLLWKNSFQSFDEVPNLVRTPLLYNYVVQNYGYADSIGSYKILVRQEPQPGNMDFWRMTLGDVVDLGFIAGSSAAENFVAKDAKPLHPQSFIRADIPMPFDSRVREIAFMINGNIYRISFMEREGVTKYFIHADRIWFLNLANRLGLRVTLLNNPGVTPSVQLVTLNLSRELLY